MLMTELDSNSKGESLSIILSLDEDDDAVFRKKQTRQLLSVVVSWPEVKEADLAVEGVSAHARSGGEKLDKLFLELAPSAVKNVLKRLLDWLSVSDTKKVKIEVRDVKVEVPSDMDVDKLGDLVKIITGAASKKKSDG